MSDKKTRHISTAERYFQSVVNGEIVACKKMKQLAKIMLPRIQSGYKDWHFDYKKASRPVRFIENFCMLPSGKLGTPFLLEDYEKAIVETLFGFVDNNGIRQFQELLVIIARKNGKTSLSAAIELYLLIADGEGAPQIYNVATNTAQASLGYGAACKMVKQSKYLSKHIEKGTVVERKNDGLKCPKNYGYITVLSSGTRSLDGLDVHGGIIDELSAIVNRDQYDLVRQGMGGREQPILIEITTNGFERGGIFDTQYDYAVQWLNGEIEDDSFLPFIYELDSREEWTDESCWIKSNPGLGTVKKVSYLRSQVKKAMNDPSYLPTLLTKDFNIPENRAAAWLTFDEAVNTETFDFKEMGFRYCIAGFDAADTIDLSAATAMLMRPNDDKIYEMSMYWLPEDALKETSGNRRERDDVPYLLWRDRGLLRTVPGNKVDKKVFLDWLRELREDFDIYTYALGYDPWHMDDTTRRDLEDFVGKSRSEVVRQGVQTLSQPMKQLRADLKAGKIINNHNPIDEWCRMNVSVKTDVNGNIQPCKVNNNPSKRIDGFMSELDAYITLERHRQDYLNVI